MLQRSSSKVWAIAYATYLSIGLYGALWVSDEFDQQRLHFYAFFALPLGILWPYSLLTDPAGWALRPRLRRGVFITIAAAYSWGASLWLNAVSGSKPITYTRLSKSRVEQRSLAVAYRRGSLGWPYRLRW